MIELITPEWLPAASSSVEYWGKIIAAVSGLTVFTVFLVTRVLAPMHRRFVRPVLDTLIVARDLRVRVLPILLGIADQFKPNGGNSLRDTIDRIESKLSRSDVISYALLQSMPIGVFETDSIGRIIWANERFSSTIGVPEDVPVGMLWHMVVCNEMRDRARQDWDVGSIIGANYTSDYLLEIDGRKVPVRCRVKFFIAPDGSVMGALVVMVYRDDPGDPSPTADGYLAGDR